MNVLMAADQLHRCMVSKEGCHRIPNFHLYDEGTCPVLCCYCHRDSHCGYIVCFSMCWNEEEEEKKCRAFMSWFKKAASGKDKKINIVIKGNINDCIENEFTHGVKEKKHWYDWTHDGDVGSYPVDDFRILAYPATHSWNSLHGQGHGTDKGRW